MVTGWRRAFCTSVSSRDREKANSNSNSNSKHKHKHKQQHSQSQQEEDHHRNRSSSSPTSPKSTTVSAASNKFGFFSNPTTPRLPPHPVTSLRCRTTPNSPSLQCHVSTTSNPSSPKSPSAFSLLKLRVLSKVRCGICLQSVKPGQGTAIFTAECSHSFHFPCIASRVVKKTAQTLLCPVCNAAWKELPLLSFHHHGGGGGAVTAAATTPVKCLRVYDDDEPLMSPTSAARFNPIPEEGDDETDEFQGFFAAAATTPRLSRSLRSVDVRLLPETAIVAAGRGYETYAVVMKVKASAAMSSSSRRPPVDLVAVVDVGSAGRMQAAKRAMRLVVSSLGSADRLSIVAFSSMSKRLLPLRRMNGAGKRSAQKIAEALVAVSAGGQGISVGDAVKKAVKVLEDRREKNSVSTIVVLSDSEQSTAVSSTRFSVHAVGLADSNSDALAKRISGVIRVAAQDLQLQLSLASGSAPAEITAVYSLSRRPSAVGSGTIRLGDFHSDEERELLVEIRVPTCTTGSHHVLSVRSSHREPSSTEAVHSRDHPLLVPRLHAVRSSPATERLRNLHVATRAVAESRRLIDHGDLTGANHLLSSSRALLSQSSSGSAEEFSRGLEAYMIELHRLRSQQQQQQRSYEKPEPLTPTSAWRAAERLAKVAIMRKSMNRVSDLHGFENARF